MKVREYLNLVKWLDNHHHFELRGFLLFPMFPVALDIRTLGVPGYFDAAIVDDDVKIKLDDSYRYLLEFYVVKDSWYHGIGIGIDDGFRSVVKLEISPKYQSNVNLSIPNTLWCEKLSEYDNRSIKGN